MSEANLSALFWKGFRVDSYEVKASDQLHIRLVPDPDVIPVCSGCDHGTHLVHDVHRRRVRERNFAHYRVWLDVPVRRLRCPQCGPRRERIDWLAGRRHLTQAMVDWVEALSRFASLHHVGQLLGLHWHTIRALDHQRLRREVPEPDRSGIRRLLMDEFALHKGHHYATVVMDADRRQILWIGEGRSRAAIRPFFEWLGPEACHQIEAVAMDMNTAFDLEVQAHCPNARIVYDLFHVVAKFGREVIDRVRVDQAKAIREDRPAYRAVKRSRWLLLRNRVNLDGRQQERLDTLLEANAPLMTVYVLKEQLKEIWYAPSEDEARSRWEDWKALVDQSAIKPLKHFASVLGRYLHGIVASATHRLNTSVLEGMNNRIKVIKRMAYGYRDTDYFFLKIRAAFHGKVR
ncbi:ISL3 family transposase [Guyparkeria halophila]|uniref:ISL3 family transposase n=1 Tax=Guyparkeria halophila TaxID=47960 RepID=A0A6I6CZN7_9GAMM|nr:MULTISPECIES: ISL3 family transposase [Guyparkeria]QGT77397.1 ISL3 family transposase [Guyparkeria halophila]QGT77704.1 ISL3 family transposase [Guyparkeria halophila]QGT78118.1 ISL3 family transposase [Guyparkeria halophila]QGT78204.1 ISL3 family transposase [Guyparkeria halophila]TKA88609.1 ISL3 family transposase [Guyparkeria sp. SB14A]